MNGVSDSESEPSMAPQQRKKPAKLNQRSQSTQGDDQAMQRWQPQPQEESMPPAPYQGAQPQAEQVQQAPPPQQVQQPQFVQSNGAIRQSRIKDRPVPQETRDSSLKVKIELDLEAEVDLYARVKGDVTIGLM